MPVQQVMSPDARDIESCIWRRYIGLIPILVEVSSVVKLNLRRSLLALCISDYWVSLLAERTLRYARLASRNPSTSVSTA
jgi:hypothetical protein